MLLINLGPLTLMSCKDIVFIIDAYGAAAADAAAFAGNAAPAAFAAAFPAASAASADPLLQPEASSPPPSPALPIKWTASPTPAAVVGRRPFIATGGVFAAPHAPPSLPAPIPRPAVAV